MITRVVHIICQLLYELKLLLYHYILKNELNKRKYIKTYLFGCKFPSKCRVQV